MGFTRVVLAVGLAVGLTGFGPAAAAVEAPESAAVLVEEYRYQPPAVTVAEGGTVTWTLGADPEQHTVTPRDATAFDDSGQLFAGDTYEVTFDRAGTYEYLCTLHPTMVGTVTVEPSAASSPTPAARRTAEPASTPVASASALDPPPPPAPAATTAEPLLLVIAAGILLAIGLIALRRLRPSRSTGDLPPPH